MPDFSTRQFPDAVDHPPDQYFGGRGARRHADPLLALQPGRVDLFRPVDQVAIDATRELVLGPLTGPSAPASLAKRLRLQAAATPEWLAERLAAEATRLGATPS